MVTFLELVGLALGSASLFGLVMGIFSVYNGRATRRLILKEEGRTQELMKDVGGRLEAILVKNTEILTGVQASIGRLDAILVKNTEILTGVQASIGRLDAILVKNTEILSKLAEKA